MQTVHEPVIVGFLCNWCSYRAADLAGMTRTPCAPGLRTIRLLCTGRVGPELVLKTLAEGADGVLVVGCRLEECHYVDGNVKALRRLALLGPLLRQFGIEESRVRLAWAAASEGELLAAEVARMSEALRLLGPLRWPRTGGATA